MLKHFFIEPVWAQFLGTGYLILKYHLNLNMLFYGQFSCISVSLYQNFTSLIVIFSLLFFSIIDI